jgi:hypothetical protein
MSGPSVVIVEAGVVAELYGEFFGVQYADGQCTEYGFGPIEKAKISDPKYCKKPSDMTYKGSYVESKLKAAVLRQVIKTTTYEVA